MNSDIFNEYAKIAIDKGLVKEAQEESKTTETKTNPRYDSLTLDDIKALYGIKPDGEQPHIVEQAHPEPVVVSPAYDRTNGLVENLLERQNIIYHIVTKPNHGKHIQEAYVRAHQDLVDELVKTAFALDRDGHEDLMSLADNCANRMVKTAVAPLLVVGLVGVAAIALVNHFGGMIDEGVKVNSDRAVEELRDLYDDMPQQTDMIDKLIADIEYVRNINDELSGLSITTVTSAHDPAIDNAKELLKKYSKAVFALSGRIDRFLAILNASASAGRAESETSWLAEYLGDPGLVYKELKDLIWAPDTADAATILETLKKSLSESIGSMRQLFMAVKHSAENGDTDSLEKLLGVDMKQEEGKEAPVEPLEQSGLSEPLPSV